LRPVDIKNFKNSPFQSEHSPRSICTSLKKTFRRIEQVRHSQATASTMTIAIISKVQQWKTSSDSLIVLGST
jgi:hypothetical protein